LQNTAHRRTIRSYVLRQGRLTTAQARAIELHWQRFGIDFTESGIDLNRIFGRAAPKVLEIGSGTGATIADLAARFPENDYLAVEVHKPGVGGLIRKAVDRELGNIRIICHDAVEVVRHQLPDNSLDQVLILFPDPWPKKRHHKRRLINAEFAGLLRTKLKMNATLLLATDDADLATYMLEVCDNDPGLFNLAGKGYFSPSPAWRRPTKFEDRGLGFNHRIWDLCYCRAC